MHVQYSDREIRLKIEMETACLLGSTIIYGHARAYNYTREIKRDDIVTIVI